MMILRGEVTLFAYYDLGGLWKISKKITSSIGGANHSPRVER